MKKIIGVSMFLLVIVSTVAFAQSTNWTDYGLTEDDVQYLSEEEKQEILNSKTPAQSQEYFKKGIQDESISPEEVPVQYLNILDKTQNNNTPEKPPLSSEVVSCFDYYTFGSVEVPIQSRISSAVSGTDITFFGNMVNKNPYPIVEGTLYIKIMKNTGGEKNPNGPDIVDQFIAIDNVTLASNESEPFEFTYKIPTHASSGEYRVVTYFTSDKKFNLQGLSFTDDIVGNSFDFSVSGEQEDSLMFDKSSVVINSETYYFAAYPPHIQKGQSANISLDVVNDSNDIEKTQIKWKLYKWDAMHPDNLIREFTTNTSIPANSKSVVELSVSEESEPVYLLVGELTYKDTKSIVNIRYVRGGVDKVRLNYPAVTSYPLIKGQQATIFTCLHNSGQSDQVANNTVVLEIKDERGKIIETYTYEGIVTGDMMAIKKDFIAKTNLNKFSVYASVYTDGKLIDESIMEYDCALIDPTTCTQKTSSSITQIIIGIIIILLLILIIIFIKRKTKGIEVVVLLFILAGSLLLFDIHIPKSSAQHSAPLPANLVNPNITSGSRQVIWGITESNLELVYFWNNDETGGMSGWARGLMNPFVSVKYNVEAKNISNGMNQASIHNNSNVPIGTDIRFRFIPHSYEDIYWFGTGYSTDSPYGEWSINTNPPPVSCQHKDFVSQTDWAGVYNAELYLPWLIDIYVPLVISPPTKTISNKNSNMTCSTDIDGIVILNQDPGGYYVDCKVVQSGQLNLDFNFSPTIGKFFYRYFGQNDLNDNFSCYGNNIVMKKIISSLSKREYLNNNYDYEDFSSEPYTLQVPAQKISYTLNAVAVSPTNTAPTISIDGPTTGTVGNNYKFTFTATDTDTPINKVKIEIDWDNDEKGDEIIPSGAEEYLSSPLSRQSSKQWSTTGAQIFKARAIDEFGAMSNWATHTITITDDLLPNTFYCEVSPVNADLNQNVTFTAYPNNAISYAWKLPDGTVVSNSQTYTRSFTSSNTYTYVVDIATSSGTQTRSCSVSVGVPLQPTISTPTATFSFRPNITNTGGTCPFILSTTNAATCSLRKLAATTDSYTGTSTTGTNLGIGRYTLSCTDSAGISKLMGSASCYSNADVRED